MSESFVLTGAGRASWRAGQVYNDFSPLGRERQHSFPLYRGLGALHLG